MVTTTLTSTILGSTPISERKQARIPNAVLAKLDLSAGDTLAFVIDKDRIILQKAKVVLNE